MTDFPASPVTELLNRAEHYVNCNAAESGADILIVELADALRSFHHAQCQQQPRLAERLTDVIMMLDTPDAYNREYIAAVCRSILSSLSSTDRQRPTCCVTADDSICHFPACACAVAQSSPARHGDCQVCGEPADLKSGPSRFGDETWACANCWEPDSRPDRNSQGE